MLGRRESRSWITATTYCHPHASMTAEQNGVSQVKYLISAWNESDFSLTWMRVRKSVSLIETVRLVFTSSLL